MKPTELPARVSQALNQLQVLAAELHHCEIVWIAELPDNKVNRLATLFDDNAEPTFAQFRQVVMQDVPEPSRWSMQILRTLFGQSWISSPAYKWTISFTTTRTFSEQIAADAENKEWIDLLLKLTWFIYTGDDTIDPERIVQQIADGGINQPVLATSITIMALMGLGD